MDYIGNIFKRMNLQQIRNFLLCGTEENYSDDQPYSVRLKNGSDPIYDRITRLYLDEKERDKTVADLSTALTTYESVYMELGMKAGARLICQLLLSDDQHIIGKEIEL